MIDISFQQDQFEVVPTLVQSALVDVLKARIKTEMKASSSPSVVLAPVHTLPIRDMLQAQLQSFDPESEDTEAENAFYVADLGEVYRQHLRWKALLPRIEPFFGMFVFSLFIHDINIFWVERSSFLSFGIVALTSQAIFLLTTY